MRSSESLGDFLDTGDVDGDGKHDIVLKTSAVTEGRQPPGFAALRVYLNEGAGRFSPRHTFHTSAGTPVPVLLADLEGDGVSDMVCQRYILLTRK